MTAELPEIDLLDPEFYVDPYAIYALYREHAPVFWDPANEIWGIFGYDEIVDIERRRFEFSNVGNEGGGYRPKMGSDSSIIGCDDPEHATRRALVARRFTPRAVTMLADLVREAAVSLIDAALAHGGPIEVVDELAAPLPATVIQKLLGFDDSLRPALQDWANRTVALGGGPRCYNDDGIAAYFEFREACTELYERRKANPTDDLVSLWVAAEDEGLRHGEAFGLEEVIADCLLLLDGGAETTRTTIGRGLMEFASRPDQWSVLKAGADIDVAVEELIRWVTPIHNMCRVATEDAIVGDITIPAGQQVMLQYAAANRDPAYFDEPERFDITRSPNPHLAFGQGTHFCLGAALARQELAIFFDEFAARVGRLAVAEPLVEHANPFVHGLRSGHITTS